MIKAIVHAQLKPQWVITKPQCAIGDSTLCKREHFMPVKCQCVLSMIIHSVALHRNALK